MKELRDYSGDFIPNIGYEDFSKETLIELLGGGCARLMLVIDGLWYLSVKERRGDEEALACDLWVVQRMMRNALEIVTKLMKIEGKDIPTVMKFLQVDPWLWTYEYKIELKDTDRGVITIAQCPTLAALKKEGGEGGKYMPNGMWQADLRNNRQVF